MQHMNQLTLRDLINHLVNTFKLSSDHHKSNPTAASQKSTEAANATLSLFEKTYVSFPEFVDTTSAASNSATKTATATCDETDNVYFHHHHEQQQQLPRQQVNQWLQQRGSLAY